MKYQSRVSEIEGEMLVGHSLRHDFVQICAVPLSTIVSITPPPISLAENLLVFFRSSIGNRV
jgi:hypothetical protein